MELYIAALNEFSSPQRLNIAVEYLLANPLNIITQNLIFGVVYYKTRNDRHGDECQGHGHVAGCCTAVSEPLSSGISSVGSGMLSFPDPAVNLWPGKEQFGSD